MQRPKLIIVFLFIIFFLSGSIMAGIKHHPNQLVIKFKSSVSVTVFPKLYSKIKDNIKLIQTDPELSHILLEFKPGSPLQKIKESIQAEPFIEKISFNYIARIHEEKPNDPYFSRQYSLHNTGQDFSPQPDSEPVLSGTSGADIKAVDGWSWAKGDSNIIIAVIDTGICAEHEDLEGKIIQGYNFYSDNFDTRDENGHGTFVASIAAANTNNEIGMAGVCWNATLLPVKVTDPNGDSDYLTIAAGIKYAADQGAHVINISMGGDYDSFILKDAVEYAYEKGAIIIASTGNNAQAVEYPAAYDEYCLAVGASDEHDQITDFSNFGEAVDLVAPGKDVLGAYFDPDQGDILNKYALGNGTSFAVPYVAGAAALLKGYKPFLNNQTIMLLLKYTSDDINSVEFPGADNYAGYGRLNLNRLLAPIIFE